MKKQNPKLSIITPSFNQAIFLDACIRSVINQEYDNLEFIIMDGGSSDESPKVIRQYTSNFANIVIAPDKGQSDAINKGIACSNGEIIGWLNSDDALLPGSLAAVAEYFSEHPEAEWLAGHCQFTDVYGVPNWLCKVQERSASDYLRFWDSIFLPQPSVFFRKTLWDRVGGLNLNYRYAMDLDLWLRFLAQAPLHLLDKNLSINRVHGATKTSTGKEDAIKEFVQIIHSSSLNIMANYEKNEIESKIRLYFMRNELNGFRAGLYALLRSVGSYKLTFKDKWRLIAIANKNILKFIFQ